MRRLLPFLALSLAAAAPAAAEPTVGPIRVIDGDTLDVGGTRVRLFGIDAPELDQTCRVDGADWACGRWAKRAFAALYQGRETVCTRVATDRYGRQVARCTVAGADIAARLVVDGIAQAYRRYALDYIDAEKAAVFAGAGIWRGEMQTPADFRAATATATASPAPAPRDCAIKGNISARGKIYHMPGQDTYDRTRISARRGERWFCSETAAVAAGWRRARR